MNNADKLIFSVAALILVIGAAFIFGAPHEAQPKLGIAPSPTAATTNASTSIGTGTAVQILAANTGALFREVCNPPVNTGTLYLWLNSTSTGFNGASGIALGSGICLQLSEQLGDMWLGNIYGLISNVTSTVTYHEQ